MEIEKVKTWWNKYIWVFAFVSVVACVIFLALSNIFKWFPPNVLEIAVHIFAIGMAIIWIVELSIRIIFIIYDRKQSTLLVSLPVVYAVEHQSVSKTIGRFFYNEMIASFKTLPEAQTYIEQYDPDAKKIDSTHYRKEHPHPYTVDLLYLDEYIIHILHVKSNEDKDE